MADQSKDCEFKDVEGYLIENWKQVEQITKGLVDGGMKIPEAIKTAEQIVINQIQ